MNQIIDQYPEHSNTKELEGADTTEPQQEGDLQPSVQAHLDRYEKVKENLARGICGIH